MVAPRIAASWRLVASPLRLIGVLALGLTVALGAQRALPAHANAPVTITVSTCDEAHLDATIAQANADNAGDTVTFACNGGILLSHILTLTGSMTLDGGGHAVTLDGQDTVRVLFSVH